MPLPVIYTKPYLGGFVNAPSPLGPGTTEMNAAVVNGWTQGLLDLTAAVNNDLQPTVGDIVCPAPVGGAADTTAIQAAITAAGSTGRVLLHTGTYWLTGHLVIPNGVDLIGTGGGSVSTPSRTTLHCTAAASQLEIAGGGGTSGGFLVDGNSTATTPFKRSGGAGANNRVFRKIIVTNNAVSGTNSNDLALFYGAQNDSWYDCGFAGADRDARVFDQGYGGANFYNCKVNTAGRYIDRYDDAVGGGVYAVPTQIAHIGGILEGNAGANCVYGNVGSAIAYDHFTFYSLAAPSGAHIQVNTGFDLSLQDPTIQVGTSTTVAATIGIAVAGVGRVVVKGSARVVNLAVAINLTGTSAFVYDKATWFFGNVPTVLSGTGSGLQIADFRIGVQSVAAAAGTATELNYNAARTGFQFAKTVDGTLEYWSAGGFGTFDTSVGVLAAGVWGVQAATYLLGTGFGTKASRPTGYNGATYANSDTERLDVYVAGAWKDGGKDSWSRYLDLRSTPISISSGTWTQTTTSGFPSVGNVAGAYNAQWATDVGAGTWTFDVMALSLSNAGIVNYDYSIDGGSTWVSIGASVDLYAVTTTVLKSTRLTGQVIAKPTKMLVRVSGGASKNGSSTAYYSTMVAFQAQRTV